MIRLSVNLNKIATLRNARGGNIPDVVAAARTCIAAGCHGITVHPRPDARHITFQDVLDLAAMLTVEFNIEGYPGAGIYRPRAARPSDPGDAGPRPARCSDLERRMEPGGRRGRLARRSARASSATPASARVFSSRLIPRRSNAHMTLARIESSYTPGRTRTLSARPRAWRFSRRIARPRVSRGKSDSA